MTAGLQVNSEHNLPTLDMTSSISQMVGHVDTGAVNGSITLPSLPPGKTYFHAVSAIALQDKFIGARPGVTLTQSGGNYVLSWQYLYADGWRYALNCRIHYGYY